MSAESERCCLGCGYNLRGLETPRCPECGRAFDPADPLTYGPRGRVTGGLAYLMTAVGLVGATLLCWAILWFDWVRDVNIPLGFIGLHWMAWPITLCLAAVVPLAFLADHARRDATPGSIKRKRLAVAVLLCVCTGLIWVVLGLSLVLSATRPQ